MEKVASIVARHVRTYQEQSEYVVDKLVLVGGSARFPGIAEVVEEYTGLRTGVPQRPLFVTPLGIAMHDKVLET